MVSRTDDPEFCDLQSHSVSIEKLESSTINLPAQFRTSVPLNLSFHAKALASICLCGPIDLPNLLYLKDNYTKHYNVVLKVKSYS